ncbi:hypothetical protein BH09BAC1_BH09BAC1_17590 [soil metagenome]
MAILFHSGAYTVVFLDFQFNQSYIASNLCVNRFRPELKCDGKCYLRKQLSKQEQNPDSGVLTVQQNLLWVLEAALPSPSTAIPTEPSAVPAAYYQSFFTQHSAVPRPHPPCAA